MGIVMIVSPLLLALMLPLLVLSSPVEPEHLMKGKNSVSCPGETGPGCRCDIYNGEFFCDEASEKCCNVDGNTFCAPLWQSCFQSEHQETELRQDCPGQTAPGCWCDEYPCADDGTEYCCNRNGNYQCMPTWQDCH